LFVAIDRRTEGLRFRLSSFFSLRIEKPAGIGPPANHQETQMQEHLLFLPLIVVTLEVKVKVRIIVKRR
jgi:hypothetical protein